MEPAEIILGTRFRAAVPLDEARARARAYLEACGYRVDREGDFTRGAGALTALALSPRWWGVKAAVELAADGEGVAARSRFTVTVTGQAPTAWELAFWRQEVLGLEAAVSRGEDAAPEAQQLARRAVGLNLALFPALAAVLLGPTLALAWYSDRMGWPGTTFALAAVPVAALSFGAAALVMRAVAGAVGTLPRVDGDDEG